MDSRIQEVKYPSLYKHTSVNLMISGYWCGFWRQTLITQSGLQLGRNRIGGELLTRIGDINDVESLKTAIQGCDAVICAVGARFGPNGMAPGGAPKVRK